MSSILLSNPFVVPNGPALNVADVTPAVAIQPASQSQPSAGKGDNSAFSGSNSGSGQSAQANTVALMQKHSHIGRPGDATPTSVINAQTQDSAPPMDISHNLPEVDMPDPLPTSPFLKRD